MTNANFLELSSGLEAEALVMPRLAEVNKGTAAITSFSIPHPQRVEGLGGWR